MERSALLRPDDDVRAPTSIPPEQETAEIIDFAAERARRDADAAPQLPEKAPLALIFRPARSAMTSGPRPKAWRLELVAERPQWLEPLMGWTAGDDPHRQISLTFRTREAALDFARHQGWRPLVLPENPRKPVIRSYADNFRPGRRG